MKFRKILCLIVLIVKTCLSQDNTAIDFSGGEVDLVTGAVCVEIEEEREVVEQDTEQQCTQQIVSQCYQSYNTQYRDIVREECEDVFTKTCKIVMRQKSYNHTSRVCKRPLLKECFEPLPTYGYGAPPPVKRPEEPNVVCRSIFETKCDADETGVTRCGQEERRICAEDTCVLVEGEEQCQEFLVENTLDVPDEVCSLEPSSECRNVTTSIPQLVPVEECRDVPKELCQTVFMNPKTVKVVDFVKYCKNDDKVNERLNLIQDLGPDDKRKLEKLVKQEKERREKKNKTPKRRTPRLSNRARLLSG